MPPFPRERSTDEQLFLFETKKLTPGFIRQQAGDFFEDCTAKLTYSKRRVTDSRFKFCPDIVWHNTITNRIHNAVFEIKSVGVHQHTIIYDHRLHKDLEFCQQSGYRFYYWFWHHKFDTNSAETLSDLHSGLARNLSEVFILDLNILAAICKQFPVKRLNKAKTAEGVKFGYGGKGYGHGWSLPVSLLRDLCCQHPRVSTGNFCHNMTVHGVTLADWSFYSTNIRLLDRIGIH